MTDHKFADDELEKTLHICSHYAGNCSDYCPLRHDDECVQTMARRALALINRQKAQIDELKVELDAMRGAANSYKMHYEKAKAEAVKEFAKKIKTDAERICDDNYIEGALIKYVDTLVKEMMEESK